MQINSKKTAFVIGTGPSLNTIDVKKLSDYDCVTFNRAYIAFDDWGFVPRYYLSIDGNDLRSIYKDINLLVKKHKNTNFFVVDDPANLYFPEDSFQDCEKNIIFLIIISQIYIILNIFTVVPYKEMQGIWELNF